MQKGFCQIDSNPLVRYNGITKHRKISKYTIFIIATAIIKIFLMGFFSSDYQNKMFYPFVMDFIENGGNVYERFYNNGITNSFPYPTIMLILECSGALIIKLLNVTNIFFRNVLFKLPTFILDLVGCFYLSRMMNEVKRRYVAVFYYASPITIYGAYMHSQLDIIPTVWLIIALYYLTTKKNEKAHYVFSAFFIIIALLCKLHILAVLPLIFLYIQKRENIQKAILYFMTIFIGVGIGIAPVCSMGFYSGVLFNSEQSVLTQVSFRFATVEMYIPIVAVLIIYLLTFKLGFINRELFVNLCGIIFALFLALCPPMPGWYIWIVPFIAIFFANSNMDKHKNIIIYVFLNMLYLLYFVFFHNRGYIDIYFLDYSMSYLKVENAFIRNLLFTLMSGTLLYLVFSMYQIGVASNMLYKRKNIPFTIGIAGDSGSGKSMFLDIVEKTLGASNLLCIEGDGDHRWERDDKNWKKFTALDPKANYLYRQAENLRQLREGGTVQRVDYDHNIGKFTAEHKIKPKKYVVLCGLHAMYLPHIRKYLDLKIYMDTDENLRRYWKIQRDITTRGHSKKSVIESIENRMPDAEKYIYPQKQYADLIVRYFDKDLHDCMTDNHVVKISVQLFFSLAVNVEPLMNELADFGLHVTYDYAADMSQQVITLDADELENQTLFVDKIADNVIPQIEEISREKFGKSVNAREGIIILVLLLLISNKMQEFPV